MSNDAAVTSSFTATSAAEPAGSSVCSDSTHSVTWTISSNLLSLQVDRNSPENFAFDTFTPCSYLDVPLYVGGVKGQRSFTVAIASGLAHHLIPLPP